MLFQFYWKFKNKENVTFRNQGGEIYPHRKEKGYLRIFFYSMKD